MFGERYRLLRTTEAAQSRPLLSVGAQLSLEWFSAILGGDEQKVADVGWELLTSVSELSSENSSASAHSTEEDRAALRPFVYGMVWLAGDAMLNSPGFSWDSFEGGDRIVDSYYSYDHNVHHTLAIEIFSTNSHLWGSDSFILVAQYGRVDDARRMMDDQAAVFKTFSEHKASVGYVLTMVHALAFSAQVQHIQGLPLHLQTWFATAGVTFDTAEEWLDTLTKPSQGSLFRVLGHKGPGGGLFSLDRQVWHIKAMCVLNLEVPEAKSLAWLKSLPDNETINAYSMSLPTSAPGGAPFYYGVVWIALAHEKVGLHDGALRFADLQLEPDVLKGGFPLTKWPRVMALACKGRVFARLHRPDEALVAFRAAITLSKDSYSLMEAFALRELANYVGIGEAAVKAGKDLEVKLKMFEGRMTKEEFDGLTIAPGRNQIIAVSLSEK